MLHFAVTSLPVTLWMHVKGVKYQLIKINSPFSKMAATDLNEVKLN